MTIALPRDLDFAVVGGGAAGFFGALHYAARKKGARAAIFEKGPGFLQKVRISGGGRCNVTHACFDPKKLAEHYPRGTRELRAAFHQWQPQDTIDWFERRGVALKTEADGRMFPTTDDSGTIIDCFHKEAERLGIEKHKKTELVDLVRKDQGFALTFANGLTIHAAQVLLAGGSLKANALTKAIEKCGHPLEPLVPSLFAVNVADRRLSGLSGISLENVSVTLSQGEARQGPILITHRGLSGPAILRLSAWEARTFAAEKYHLPLRINWLPTLNPQALQAAFANLRTKAGRKRISKDPLEGIPKRLWERLVEASGIDKAAVWSQLKKDAQHRLTEECLNGTFEITGKTTNREEFVTAGGVKRSSINFKTMESRHTPGLYFAGECIDMDGITGGFNFQAAWTTAVLAARAAASKQAS